MFPTRFVHLPAARARFGDRVDRLGAYLSRVDETADRVVESIEEMAPGVGWKMFDEASAHGVAHVAGAPESFRAFFAEVERVPVWVDWATLDRGGEVLLRAGVLGGIVLGLKSLVTGYATPAGNKPLVFSGRLAEHAPRRLQETSRFVQATIRPGGLRPHADGYRITLKVRLIHAQVRRLILRSGRWDAGAWGAPVNQHDQVGTLLLFSLLVLEGLRQLGMHVSSADADAYMHLWRYSGTLMGVDAELVPTTESDAFRLGELIAATQGEPDADSRLLTRALLEASSRGAKTDQERKRAARQAGFSAGLCRALIGTELADKLGVPTSSWRRMMPVIRRLVSGIELVREAVPFVGAPALQAGTRYWDRVVEVGLTNATIEFGLPQRLAA
jgi:hypothetical protein